MRGKKLHEGLPELLGHGAVEHEGDAVVGYGKEVHQIAQAFIDLDLETRPHALVQDQHYGLKTKEEHMVGKQVQLMACLDCINQVDTESVRNSLILSKIFESKL